MSFFQEVTGKLGNVSYNLSSRDQNGSKSDGPCYPVVVLFYVETLKANMVS